MIQYKILPEHILRINDNAIIPINDGNRDYIEYLEWIKAGNIPMTKTQFELDEEAVLVKKNNALAKLYEIDQNSIRALRELTLGKVSQETINALTKLEDDAIKERLDID